MPDLRSVIERTANYAYVDGNTSEIVVDAGAVLLGILEVGRFYREISSAVWFYEWLLDKSSEEKIEAILQRNYKLAEKVYRDSLQGNKRLPVIISPLLNHAVTQAASIARQTSAQERYELRHLIAAVLIQNDAALRAEPNCIGVLGGIIEILPNFIGHLYSQIQVSPTHDKIAVWSRVLGRSFEDTTEPLSSSDKKLGGDEISAAHVSDHSDQSEAQKGIGAVENSQSSMPPSVSENQIPGFSTDRPGIDAGDSLGVDPDVQAFARLICLKDARPPLSIGLFGGWGAGKSTFMERLETAIKEITNSEARRRENVKTGRALPQPPGAPEFLTRVAHIRFNAWQYSDANLWASLTTEFFDQLRAEGRGRQGRALHDKLVERVKAHVSTLAGSADATRKALADSEDALMVAEKARDDAAAKVNAVKDEVLEKSLREDLAASFDRNKKALVAVGLLQKDADPSAAIKNFANIVAKLRTLPGKLSVLGHAIWNGRYRWLVVIVFLAIIAAGLTVALAPEWVAQFRGWIAGTGMLVVLGVFGKPVLVVIRLILDTTSIADKLKEADAAAQKDLSTKEDEVRIKAKEVEARRATAARAETALARYAGPPGSPSSPRLLHFLLNDDPETKQIEGQIGLISRARRLFQAVDEIAAEERGKDNTDEDVPERIVLYIDDLDRCSHDQVYAVLQAVHLLLAFELFVVVVGVDVAWVEEAITRQLRDGPQTQGDDEIKRRKRAIDYLQKIFQIPFWLKPLSTDGNDGGSYGRFIGALVGPVGAVEEAHEIVVMGEEAEDLAGKDSELVVEPETDTVDAGGEENSPVAEVEAIEEARALATMRLDPREVEFLKSPAIGAIAAHDPRGVKRMINTYRLARARMSREDLDKLLDAKNPTYPILALFTAIETGQPVEIADAVYSLLLLPRESPSGFKEVLTVKEDEQKEVLKKASLEGKPTEEGVVHCRCWHAIVDTVGYAMSFRQHPDIPRSACLPIARLVRRYSFSRKQ